MLPAKADTPTVNNADLNLKITAKQENLFAGKSIITFSLEGVDPTQVDPNQLYTIFLFYGDNFYTSYKQFTAKYSEFPQVIHEYIKPGKYKPLLIAYSNNFQYRQFKFFDPLEVKIDEQNIDLNARQSFRQNNLYLGKAKVNFTIETNGNNLNIGEKPYTFFLFYGDEFYKNYKYFNGKFSDIPVIEHEYMQPGTYKPVLIAYSNNFKYRQFKTLDPIIVTKVNSDKPIANGSLLTRIDDKNNNQVAVSFTGENSYDPFTGNGNKLSYKWDFGDGSTVTNANNQFADHIYTSSGTFTPSLVVQSTDGRVSESFTLNPIEINQSTICNNPAWNNTGICKADCGSQQGLQEQINSCGTSRFISCSSQVCLTTPFIVKNQYLEAPGYLTIEADISNLSKPEELSYRFILEPNSLNKKEQIFKRSSFLTEEPGTYNVVLEIYRSSYLISKSQQTITLGELNKAPVAIASISKNNGEAALTVGFDASNSYDPEGSTINYHWDFGDNNTANGSVVSHTYTKPGKYKPILRVNDLRDFYSEKIFDEILVEEKNFPPVARFATEVKDCNLTQNEDAYLVKLEHKGNQEFYCNVNFDGLISYDPNKNLSSYEWLINNSNGDLVFTSSQPKFLYKFNKYDDYAIKLKVKDSKNLSTEVNSLIKILEPNPVAIAMINSRNNDLELGTSTIEFSGLKSFAYNNIPNSIQGNGNLSFTWNMGDEQNYSEANFTHTYNTPGTYSPRLTVCKYCDDLDNGNDLITKTALETIIVDIEKPTLGSVSFSNLLDVEGTSSSVNSVTIGNITSDTWKWIYKAFSQNTNGDLVLLDKSTEFNANSATLNILDAPVSFSNAGQYELVHDLDGKQILSETLTVLPNQIPIPKITLTHNLGDYSATVSAEGSYDPKSYDIASYTWEFGDGTNSTGITASHTYANPGIYYIKLTVVDAKGLIANAYSNAVIVGDFISHLPNAPLYTPLPDIEPTNESIISVNGPKMLSVIDKQNDFISLTEIPNSNQNYQESTLTLPGDNSCSQVSCKCTAAFNQGIQINSLNFIQPSSSVYKDNGAKVVEILGTNFCTYDHLVRVKVDDGEFEDRAASFISSGKITARLKAKDFRGNSLTIRVKQTAANSSINTADKTIQLTNKIPANLDRTIFKGSSSKINLITEANNFFIQSDAGQGDAYHYWDTAKGPIFISQAGTLYSKNIFVKEVPANTKAKLAVDLNGNRFDGIKVKVNGVKVLDKNPGTGNKFSRVVTDAFDLVSGELKIEINLTNPSDMGVIIRAITIVSSPERPTVSNLDVFFPVNDNARKLANIKVDTSPNTFMYAALINRQTQNGLHAGDYKILEANVFNGVNSSSLIQGVFSPVDYKPGEYCIYFYLDNGIYSNDAMKDMLRNTVFSKYNNALANNKYAYLNQGEMMTLKNTALSLQHGACFYDKTAVTVTITEPNFSSIIAQANNQNLNIKLQTTAPSDIKSKWQYDVRLLSGSNEADSLKNYPLAYTMNGTEQIRIPIKTDYVGNYNLLVHVSYFDPIIKKTYVGEASKQINIIEDLNPVAKIVTKDTNKLLLESTDDPNQKAEFLGYYSYDPNKSVFAEQINDGIQSYNWSTEFRSLDASSESFSAINSPYQSNSNVYAVGPNKTPGIYRAVLKVFDFFNRSSKEARSDSVQIVKPGQHLLASLSVKNPKKILEPDLAGNAEVKLQANIKVIDAEKNKPTSIQYKFIYDDGTEENGSVSQSQFQLNKFIDLPALQSRSHIYAKGEYIPKLTVSATFKDGTSESWTVSAGTVTIAELPTLVAFTPIIANLGANEIANPGFIAQLKVTGKQIFNTDVESFGWIFGDGSSWTYSGNNPNQDFMKSSVTNTTQTYAQVGIYEIKFWVKTVDKPNPVTFTLRPLEIRDMPFPEIQSLSINQKQGENIEISDEELINIEAFINSTANLNRVDLAIRSRGDNSIVFTETFIGGLTNSFSKTLYNLYLNPGEYFVDFRAVDEFEREVSKILGFEVVKAKGDDQSVDFSDLEDLYDQPNFTSNNIHKIPITINKFLKSINVYNDGRKIKVFEGVLPDEVSSFSNSSIEDYSIASFDEVHEGDIYVPLHEGENNISLEITLPNSKVIRSKPYIMTLDSTDPVIEIETPSDLSIYGGNKLTLAGRIYDENLAKLYYRINSNTFKKLDFEFVGEEIDLSEFEKDFDLDSVNIKETNFIEIKAVDKGGNAKYTNATFIVSNELISKIRTKPKTLIFGGTPEGNLDISDEQHAAGDLVCDEIKSHYGFDGSFMEHNFNNVTGSSGGLYSVGSDGYYMVKSGSPFNVEFKLQVCDYSIGEAETTVPFSLDRKLNYQGQSYSLPRYGNEYFSNVFPDGSNYKYRFFENVAGLSQVNPYLTYKNMNYKTSEKSTIIQNGVEISGPPRPTYFEFDDLKSIGNTWRPGYYDFNSGIYFYDSGHKFVNGTYPDADAKIGINILSSVPNESIAISSVVRIPEVVYIGHNIDSVILKTKVSSFTELDSYDRQRFRFYIKTPERDVRLTYEKNNLDISYNPTGLDENYRYTYDITFTASDLPRLSGSKNINHYYYLVQLLNEAGDSISSFDTKEINLLKAPDKYIYLKVEEDFPEDYPSDQRLKEEGFVSNRPKNFKLTVYHIADNGLTLQENMDTFDPTTSPILSRLKIRKISLDNLDEHEEVKDISDSEKTSWNGNQLSFRLKQNSIYIHPSMIDFGGFNGNELENYKGFWKTEYISSGPDDGGTLIKDAGKLEFEIKMQDWFNQQKLAGFDFSVEPKQQDTQLYDLDPYPIDLKDLEIETDNLFFRPNITEMITNPEKLYLLADTTNFHANLSYQDAITDKYRLPKFEYTPRKTQTNEEKKEKLKAGFLIQDKEDDKEAFVQLNPFSAKEDINITPNGSDNYTLTLPVSLLLDNEINTLLEKNEMVDLDKNKTLQVPISIITKSNKDLDIELRGTYKQKAFPLSILDFPKYELMKGKEAKKLSPEELEQKSSTITLDSKNNLYFRSYYSNIIDKKTDPLELEVQLYDGAGLGLGESFPINKQIMSEEISNIVSKSYSADEPTRLSIQKMMKINISKFAPTELKEFLDEAEFVRVKLKRDYLYLQTIVPEGEDIYQYYDVNDNDPYRSKYMKINTNRRNSCYFTFPGSDGRHMTLKAFNENRINGELMVNFTSASRKKAKVWVTYTTQKSTDEINTTFANGPYSSENFEDPENPGTFVEVDSINNRISINEGIFKFKNLDLPKNTNRYTLLFKVAQSNANENSVNWNGFDADKAAVCSVEIIKGIEDAQVFIDRLELPSILNQIPINRDYEVIVRTDPAESIEGVNLFIEDLNTGERKLLNNYHTIREGMYLKINLKSLGIRTLNRPYSLIAELTYNSSTNNQETEEKARRDFIFVTDTEPNIVFGDNDFIGDITSEDGSGNIIFARPHEDYHFNGSVSLSNLSEDDIEKINFKLFDKATGSFFKDIGSTPNALINNSVSYNLDVDIPFNTIEDVKEYSIYTYKDNQILSKKVDFLLINNPEVKINTSKDSVSFETENDNSLDVIGTIQNGFTTQLNGQVLTYINGDPDQGEDHIYNLGKQNSNFESTLEFVQTEDDSSQNFSAIAIRLALAALGVVGITIESKYLPDQQKTVNKILDRLPPDYIPVIAAFQAVSAIKSISVGSLAYLDIDLIKNGEKQTNDLILEGDGNYELEIFSSRPGKVIVKRSVNGGNTQTIATVNIASTENVPNHIYDKFENSEQITSKGYSQKIAVTAPSLLPGTDIGIAEITLEYVDEQNRTQTKSKTFIQTKTKNSAFELCIYREAKNEAIASGMNADLLNIAKYMGGWILQATTTVLAIKTNGIPTISGGTYRGISTGSIYEDLVRLLPRTQGVNVNSTAEATGYCKSLAKHIVHYKERPGLFRVFESKNHLSSNTEADYNVYWLSYERLQHIYENHGPNKNLNIWGRFPKDSIFNQNDRIVNLIKDTIDESSPKNRFASPANINETAFWGNFGINWKDNGKKTTQYLEIRTSNKFNSRIETCFPLSQFANEYSQVESLDK